MKIIYLATQFPKNDDFVVKRSKNMLQYAADHVSKMFVEGIQVQQDVEVEVYNIIPTGSWPTESKCIYVPETDWYEKNIKYSGVSYCNICGIRQYSKYYHLKRKLKDTLLKQEDCWVVAYSLSTPILQLFRYIKCNNPKIKIALIVPDLPQYMNEGAGKLYHYLKEKDIEIQRKLYSYIDSMIYFSKYMNEFFCFPESQCLVIEGAINETVQYSKPINQGSKVVILYSGGVESSYGILDLLLAFSMIKNPGYELHIIGGGSGVESVKEKANEDIRIKYLGIMDRNAVLKYQTEATVLVNPRRAEKIFTKYSFPSKTLEYMQSGTPIIMHKLSGIPEEYDNYLTYFSDNDPEHMAIQLTELCEKTKAGLVDKGKLAQEFVTNNKSKEKQMKKMCDFLKKGMIEEKENE